MVSYELPQPTQGFFSRMKEGVRLAAAFVKGDSDTIRDITSTTVFSPLQWMDSKREILEYAI